MTDQNKLHDDAWKRACSLSKQQPLAAIDYLIRHFEAHKASDSRDTKWLDLFCQCVICHASNKLTGEVDGPPQTTIFDRSVIQHPRFVAIALLRLLSKEPGFFRSGEFRNKTFNLFDEQLGRDVYGRRGISNKDQAYKKEQELSALVAQVESELLGIVSSLSHIEGLQAFQEALMRRLNQADPKSVLKPFIPQPLWEHRIQECFSAAASYRDADYSISLGAYQTAIDIFDTYLKDIDSSGSIYARDYLGAAIGSVKKVVQEHIQSSPISKPAQIRLKANDKKYPLHVQSKPFQIALNLVNEGPGVGYDVQIEFGDGIGLTADSARRRVYIGTLEPDVKQQAFLSVVALGVEESCIEVKLKWSNFDGSTEEIKETFDIKPQRSDIDWEMLASTEVYSLDPVTLEADLIGRRDILDKLTARARARTMGSSYISGQKRVGKTSIVNALQDRFSQEDTKLAFVYIMAGDVNSGDAEGTIRNLSSKLCRLVQIQDNRISHLAIPQGNIEFTSVVNFIDEVKVVASDLKMLFVIDEFDELPAEFFRDTPVGNAFFSTLRSLSSRSNVSFVLVGSENMNFALSWQGDRLNKFVSHSVDYFDKANHWNDFCELVRNPASDWLEINDEAVEAIYEQSAGNPFFTKLVCEEVYRGAVERRDSYVTPIEVEDAVRCALRAVGVTNFQHFWKDGLLTAREGAEDRSVTRRKVLLALVDSLGSPRPALKEHIIENAKQYHLTSPEVEVELADFINRKVLICQDGIYRPKVPLFERWMYERGREEVLTRLIDEDAALASRQRAELNKVKSEEIMRLVERWPHYKGTRITEDTVRTWLSQFIGPEEQRLMFTLLEGVRFYSQGEVREKMREAYKIIARDMADQGILWSKPERSSRRHDLLISHLDSSPAKSGTYYGRVFAEENGILMDKVVSRGSIAKGFSEINPCHALIFVDDILGTGRSACENLTSIAQENPEIFGLGSADQQEDKDKQLLVYIVAICGFDNAKQKIEKQLSEMGVNVSVRICDVLGDEDKCFNSASRIFTDPILRDSAMNVAGRAGKQLEAKHPFGFGDCQATVVFEASCPNNTLPILWKVKETWKPLFKR